MGINSTWQALGIPTEVAIFLTVGALAAALAPWLGGAEILSLKLPTIRDSMRMPIAAIATPLLLLLLASFYPAWRETTKTLDEPGIPENKAEMCGFFEDEYGPNGTWLSFDSNDKQSRRFWSACLVRASQTITIQSVRTNLALSDRFFVGILQGESVHEIEIDAGEADYVAVPIEVESWQKARAAFAKPSRMDFVLSQGGDSVSGNLPSLRLP